MLRRNEHNDELRIDIFTSSLEHSCILGIGALSSWRLFSFEELLTLFTLLVVIYGLDTSTLFLVPVEMMSVSESECFC